MASRSINGYVDLTVHREANQHVSAHGRDETEGKWTTPCKAWPFSWPFSPCKEKPPPANTKAPTYEIIGTQSRMLFASIIRKTTCLSCNVAEILSERPAQSTSLRTAVCLRRLGSLTHQLFRCLVLQPAVWGIPACWFGCYYCARTHDPTFLLSSGGLHSVSQNSAGATT